MQLPNEHNALQLVIVEQQTLQLVHFNECNVGEESNTVITEVEEHNVGQEKNSTNTLSREEVVAQVDIGERFEIIQALIRQKRETTTYSN